MCASRIKGRHTPLNDASPSRCRHREGAYEEISLSSGPPYGSTNTTPSYQYGGRQPSRHDGESLARQEEVGTRQAFSPGGVSTRLSNLSASQAVVHGVGPVPPPPPTQMMWHTPSFAKGVEQSGVLWDEDNSSGRGDVGAGGARAANGRATSPTFEEDRGDEDVVVVEETADIFGRGAQGGGRGGGSSSLFSPSSGQQGSAAPEYRPPPPQGQQAASSRYGDEGVDAFGPTSHFAGGNEGEAESTSSVTDQKPYGAARPGGYGSSSRSTPTDAYSRYTSGYEGDRPSPSFSEGVSSSTTAARLYNASSLYGAPPRDPSPAWSRGSPPVRAYDRPGSSNQGSPPLGLRGSPPRASHYGGGEAGSSSTGGVTLRSRPASAASYGSATPPIPSPPRGDRSGVSSYPFPEAASSSSPPRSIGTTTFTSPKTSIFGGSTASSSSPAPVGEFSAPLVRIARLPPLLGSPAALDLRPF